MTGSTSVKLFALGLVALTASACSPITAVHGNLVEPDRLASVHEGVSRQAEVADLLGSPTAKGTFDPNIWYYIGQRTEKIAFLAPQAVERKVVVVRFDATGVVRKIEELDLESGQDIDIVSRATPTAGKDMTFMEQMLSNVGRFSGSKKSQGPGAPN